MTTNDLPEAAVEAAARLMWKYDDGIAHDSLEWDDATDSIREDYTRDAHDVLSAALPHLAPTDDALVDRVAEALHTVWGYRGNPEVLIHEDPRGPAMVAVRAMGARPAPDRNTLARAIFLARNGGGEWFSELGDDADFGNALGDADAVLAVLADQPTLAEVRAQALNDAADTVAAARPDPTTGAAPGHYAGLSHAARILRARANQERSR